MPVLFLKALFLFAAVALSSVACCQVDTLTVSTVLDRNQPGFYTLADVQAHFTNTIDQWNVPYVPDGQTTLSCVDARAYVSRSFPQ
jgi:hypothetical protein